MNLDDDKIIDALNEAEAGTTEPGAVQRGTGEPQSSQQSTKGMQQGKEMEMPSTPEEIIEDFQQFIKEDKAAFVKELLNFINTHPQKSEIAEGYLTQLFNHPTVGKIYQPAIKQVIGSGEQPGVVYKDEIELHGSANNPEPTPAGGNREDADNTNIYGRAVPTKPTDDCPEGHTWKIKNGKWKCIEVPVEDSYSAVDKVNSVQLDSLHNLR